MSLAKNPDSNKFFILYISNEEKYIEGINSKASGTHAYHLYINDEEITKGFYDRY